MGCVSLKEKKLRGWKLPVTPQRPQIAKVAKFAKNSKKYQAKLHGTSYAAVPKGTVADNIYIYIYIYILYI